MTDDELRTLVRAAIARHAGTGDAPAPPAVRTAGAHLHPSHGRFARLPSGSDADGPCLIEPTVPCNHCGYCQSYGH